MEGMPVIKERNLHPQFYRRVKMLPGGEKIKACIQCGTCSGSCPSSHTMDYTPRKLIAMIRAGMEEEVLKSKAIWMCASCYSCKARCPRGIAITDLMYTLKNIAMASGCGHKLAGPVFYGTFNRMVEKEGRINEGKFIVTFTLKTDPFKIIGMAPLGMKMLAKRRLPLKATAIKNKEEFRKILARIREAGI